MHSQWLTASGAALLLLVVSANAADQPQQRPGLWKRTTLTVEDGKAEPPEKSQRCLDAAGLARVKKLATDSAKHCSKHDVRQVNSKWLDDSECSFGATTITSHTETSMTGDTAYHMENDTKFSPALGGSAHVHTVSDGAWLGPCSAK